MAADTVSDVRAISGETDWIEPKPKANTSAPATQVTKARMRLLSILKFSNPRLIF